LAKHRKIHGEKGLHTCRFEACNKSFHRLDQLKRHEGKHTRKGVSGSLGTSEAGSVSTKAETEKGSED
jgi:hypothetical protein